MRDWSRWAAVRRWSGPSGPTPLEWNPVTPLDRHPPPYAECSGPEDPFCGRCRFSVHGCNDDGPSRAEFVKWRVNS